MRELRLNITSDPARLAPARRTVEAFCQGCGFDDKAVADIGLVVNEAIANITRHAYGGATDQPIKLHASFSQDNTLRLCIRDWGSGRDPRTDSGRRDPLTPGGLGMVCLRSLMDEVTFTPKPDGMLLTMSRAIGTGRGADSVSAS
ncbi:MAG TPA: ATP-binding protein [Tepidisphaeraceae bacterium]|nr:ATP-binding protein [Tepidisphaeraceae bacterium]